MPKITPSLWFDDNAEEAINLYVSIFQDAGVLDVSRYGEAGPGPEGTVVSATFRLAGLPFMAINGGPMFTINPAMSFSVGCASEVELDPLWERLADGGTVLMELSAYPFSEKFGWVQDRFGVSWQVSLTGAPQSITPFLMFTGPHHGQAEAAIQQYTSLFPNARVDHIERYGPGQHEPEGTVMHATFTLDGQPVMAMDSNQDHAFTFTEATSLMIDCSDQAEVDYYWEKLGEGGEPGPCGWLKDRFGLSWQVVPRALLELLQSEDREAAGRVMQAMLQMTKLDIAQLEAA